MIRFLWAGFLFLVTVVSAWAQHPVDQRNTYERLICVVPMVGAGTYSDPRRPLYAPVAPPRGAPPRTGIVAFSFQPSDDGRFAIVELVARDRKAFQAILADKRSDIKVFQKGKAKRSDVEIELKKYKQAVDLDRFGAILP